MMAHTGSSLRLLSITYSQMYLVSSKIVVLLSSWVKRFYPMPMPIFFTMATVVFVYLPWPLSSLSLILILQIIFYITADSETPDLDE